MQIEIHHYDPHDYFYVGSETIQCRNGVESIPYAATDIPPPPREAWGDQQIPIFHAKERKWIIKKNDFWHPKVSELCFHSGRDSSGRIYIAANRDLENYHNDLMRYVNKLPMCSIPRIGTLPNFVHLLQRIDFLNHCIEQLEENWLRTKTGGFPLAGKEANYYHYEAETFMAAIRRFLDDLTMAVFYKKFYQYEPWKRDLPIDGYSALLNNPIRRFRNFFIGSERDDKSEGLCREFSDLVLGENRFFLITIQSLNNTYKHSLTANLARGSYGLNFPTVLSFGVEDYSNRNLGKLSYHNHSLRQLVIGLNDYLDDLTKRIASEPTNASPDKCLSHSLQSFPL